MRRVLRLLVILVVPIVLPMTMVAWVDLPMVCQVRVCPSRFPCRPFGLSPEERLRLAEATIRYLNLPGRPATLERLRLADGEPAYNERELGHMEDVKAVLDGLTLLAGIALAVGLASAWILARLDRCAPWSALAQGGAHVGAAAGTGGLDADRVRGVLPGLPRGVLRVRDLGVFLFRYADPPFPVALLAGRRGSLWRGGSACWQCAL